MATYWENSCSFGLRYVSWYKYLIVGLVFSHLGFWSGNLFLIAPFPDLCLLVPFFSNSIAENKDNSYLWQHIKDLNGKSSSKLPEELKTEDGTSNDPNTIIEKLNCYFAKISDKLKAERTKQ